MISDAAIRELGVVALLAEAPEHKLSRGQVGKIVLDLDKDTVLGGFSDDTVTNTTIAPIAKAELPRLTYISRAALYLLLYSANTLR